MHADLNTSRERLEFELVNANLCCFSRCRENRARHHSQIPADAWERIQVNRGFIMLAKRGFVCSMGSNCKIKKSFMSTNGEFDCCRMELGASDAADDDSCGSTEFSACFQSSNLIIYDSIRWPQALCFHDNSRELKEVIRINLNLINEKYRKIS